MISVPLDRSATPPPSNSRIGNPLEPSSFSSAVSFSTSPAIIAPRPLRPDPAGHHPSFPQQAREPPSTPSTPPLDPSISFARSLNQDVNVSSVPDVSLELYVDDEGLSSVEKIYVFCRSRESAHRIFISRCLHTFLSGVSPLEGVEYVLPLLNSLAVDDEDAVKQALASNLVDIMWWFFQNCRLVEDEPPEEQADPPLLPVQTFTPILGSLLIDHNGMIGAPARFAVVEILNRLRSANDRCDEIPPFGSKERRMLEQEIVHQVIIGMGRLDVSEENFPSPISGAEFTPVFPSTTSPPSSTEKNALIYSPPLPSESRSLSMSAIQLEASDSKTEIYSTPVTSKDLSSSTTSSIESLPEPAFPLPQGQSSQASFDLTSLPHVEDRCVNEMASCSFPNSEATAGESASKAFINEDRGRMMAEGQQSQDTQDEANEQAAIGRLSSMSLIATVTAHAKLPEDTIRAFADEVAYIGGDPLYWVRREASFAVGALAKVVPTEVVIFSLLPLFEALVRDSIWHVRHSALFALPGILTRLTPQHRRTLALNVLLPLSGDVSLTVRSAVLEVLGEVIYTFHGDVGGAPRELVSLFVGRERGQECRQHRNSTDLCLSDTSPKARRPTDAFSSVFENDDDSPEGSEAALPEHVDAFEPSQAMMTTPGDFFRDPARSLITSFNYPAVALSLGPGRWDEVREYYLTLTQDRNVRVRRTLAAGLGEMARILGSELTQRDLVDAWQDMTHDAEDGKTRLKALEGVCLFVGALERPIREGIVTGLVELWDKWLKGWRERECLTRAMPALAALAEGQGEAVRSLLGKALVDKIAAVREAAIGALTHVLHAFESWPHIAEALRDVLQGLASMDCCRRRATYIACCCALAEGEHGKLEVARDDFWKHIVPLSQDRVIDVRIGVARLLGIVCVKFYLHPSTRPPHLVEIIHRLTHDSSRDVRAFVAFLLVPGETSQLRHISPTTSETPPMMFATFSRPPPKAPPLIVKVETHDLESRDEGSPMELTLQEDQPQGRSPTIPEREADSLSPNQKTQEGRQGDIIPAEDPFKPPPLSTDD